ncbi:hypothetical protein PtA15_15A95 [Puccinia triticina]|uniref:Uncharacterized protein n=1 Tax=Puccinia triticina TaxID=208348 RepID=A0ABY7D4H5_9BASI|nr:uncharacterized protein PtA15_15A95 [Puccinia triticina]WAQ91704.1 hypothetical protein PtA15_15A95 [Puccinia triticina]
METGCLAGGRADAVAVPRRSLWKLRFHVDGAPRRLATKHPILNTTATGETPIHKYPLLLPALIPHLLATTHTSIPSKN